MPDGRILIADDEDSLRWVLEKGFRGAGYQVTAVKDGTAALREVEGGPFDLILLDVRMPGIDGLSLLKQVRANPDTAGTPFIMITAESKTENVIAAKQAGANNYIIKPFNAETLKHKIEAVFTA